MSDKIELEDLIDHQLIDNEELVKRIIPAGIGYLINGNMCFGIFGKYLVLRVPLEESEKLQPEEGFHPFIEKDPSMKNWIMAEPKIYQDRLQLARLLDQSIAYTSTLPEKS